MAKTNFLITIPPQLPSAIIGDRFHFISFKHFFQNILLKKKKFKLNLRYSVNLILNLVDRLLDGISSLCQTSHSLRIGIGYRKSQALLKLCLKHTDKELQKFRQKHPMYKEIKFVSF